MNRVISAIGFHGTDNCNYEKIQTAGFQCNTNPYDWLGEGVYFFQDATKRAKTWAEQHLQPVVIGAEISLEACMDFLDIEWWETLKLIFDEFGRVCRKKKDFFARSEKGEP